jgi:hypothetical protein
MLIRLHALLAVVLVLGQISLSRVFGGVWYYLALWAWGITALMLVAIVWTIGAALAARGAWPSALQGTHRVALAGTLALALVLGVFTAMFTVDASHAEVPAASLSRQLSRLAPGTVAALDSGDAPGGGPDGRYLVTWTDPVGIGATGFGLLLELEREGFHVGVPAFHATGAVPHRVLDPADATAEVHLAVGSNVAEWRANPAAVEVATAGLSDAEQARYDELKAEIVQKMDEQGVGDLAPRIDDGMMAVAIDPRLSTELQAMMERLAAIGQEAAVFVAPPSGT